MMQEHTIEITRTDALRLRELLSSLAVAPGTRRGALETLRYKLDHARIVSPNQVGRHVVTLQSRAVVEDDETWEPTTYTLVHPEHADDDGASLSILTPMGTAMLGHREGDLVEWGAPAGTLRIWIQKVLYQPESAGHEHLKYSGRGAVIY